MDLKSLVIDIWRALALSWGWGCSCASYKSHPVLVCGTRRRNEALPKGKIWVKFVFSSVNVNGQYTSFLTMGMSKTNFEKDDLTTFIYISLMGVGYKNQNKHVLNTRKNSLNRHNCHPLKIS
jgi:hypothetical protein